MNKSSINKLKLPRDTKQDWSSEKWTDYPFGNSTIAEQQEACATFLQLIGITPPTHFRACSAISTLQTKSIVARAMNFTP